MIVVDTSAMIAIFLGEPEATDFAAVLGRSRDNRIGAPTAFEFMMVARGKIDRAIDTDKDARDLLISSRTKVVEWSPALVDAAQSAFLEYGKGYHSAKLNFGDCMSYALAKSLDAPLLYKGDDFAQTDIRRAL